MDKLDGVVAFVRTIEAGSFAKAAEQLSLTASAVSKRVANLEIRLGVRLLNRTTRRLNLTVEGETFYGRCRQILWDIDEAELIVAQAQAAPKGLLRLNVSASLGRLHIIPALANFRARYPEIEFEMTFDDRFVDPVQERVDLLIRVGPLTDSGLVARRLTTTRPIVCASPDYLDLHGTPQIVDDLNQHNRLALVLSGRALDWWFQVKGREMSLPASRVLRLADAEAIQTAACAGLGIAYIYSHIVIGDLAAGRLVPLLAEFRQPAQPVTALWPSSRQLSPRVRIFVDYLAAHFKGDPFKSLDA